MNELKRSYPLLEEELFKAYDILSNAGFDIWIENGQISVSYSNTDIELDALEGLVIVDDDYRVEYDERQDELMCG